MRLSGLRGRRCTIWRCQRTFKSEGGVATYLRVGVLSRELFGAHEGKMFAEVGKTWHVNLSTTLSSAMP